MIRGTVPVHGVSSLVEDEAVDATGILSLVEEDEELLVSHEDDACESRPHCAIGPCLLAQSTCDSTTTSTRVSASVGGCVIASRVLAHVPNHMPPAGLANKRYTESTVKRS